MKSLITGIAGFGGSHLAEHLVSQQDKVYGITLPGENLSCLRTVIDELSLFPCDIQDQEKLELILGKVQPDILYHLAAEASAHKSFQQPVHFFEVNVLGTVKLFEAVRKCRPGVRLVIVTSSEIYGYVSPELIPITEETPYRPESPYAVTKVALHYLGQQYYRNFGLEIIEARAFNHIGPRQSKGFVVPDFCAQIASIITRQTPPVMNVGNLTERRDFVDVRDVARAYRLLAEHGLPGQAYNICSGMSIDIKTMLEKLIDFSRQEITIQVDKNKIRPSRMPEIRGNNNKIREYIGWKPMVSLDRSLQDAMTYWLSREKEETKVVQ